MTATLVVTDVQDSVVERLRVLASFKNRTAEQEALAILEGALPNAQPFDRAAITAMTPKGVRQSDSLELLREDRGRDDHDE